ncbi:hypothetical protein [Nocardia sp. NPDC057440]|uniref:hypothetical protein n=1 Tax=Nocardia sp. NPDC057440 TaxID=3346134 RepID=UPI003670026F
MKSYTNGDETGWAAEFEFLWTRDRERTLKIMDSVLDRGYDHPVLLGDDGRVWDGHHRIAVAVALNLSQIPTIAKNRR